MPLGTGILTLEAANLFCGSSGTSNHLRLLDVRLADLEEEYLDHRAGGAPVGIEIDVQINKLLCEFTLAGWTPEVASMISAWITDMNQFWIFGALRQRNTINGDVLKATAKIYGRLGKADPTNWQRGSVHHWSYAIRGIIQYRLDVDGTVIFDWDFFQNTLATKNASAPRADAGPTAGVSTPVNIPSGI
jgi:P2 family phage contractile tail tube protein